MLNLDSNLFEHLAVFHPVKRSAILIPVQMFNYIGQRSSYFVVSTIFLSLHRSGIM